MNVDPMTLSTPPEPAADPSFPPGDYVSPSLQRIRPDAAFPFMAIGNTDSCQWPFLRREIPHNWYVDSRVAGIGFVSRDEAHILYNIALMFRDKLALEIGCFLGWSACHLALGGVILDVIDPVLSREDFRQSITASLTAAGVINRANLIGGSSPAAVAELVIQTGRKWSLIFIDGDHEAPGPLNDAIACEGCAEPDAMIVFHDLASPAVARGLEYYRARGWKTLVYQTMQIMGVAYRGVVSPLVHHPDPQVKWVLPEHLQQHPVSL
jgi:predicted O-methyltransferase YrrM